MLLQLVGKRYPLKPVRTLKGERGGGEKKKKKKKKKIHIYLANTHTHTHTHTIYSVWHFYSLVDDVRFSVLGCRAVILGTNNPLAKGQHFIYIYISVWGGDGGGGAVFVLFVRLVGWFLLFLLLLLFCFCFVLPKIVLTVFAIRFSWPNKQHNM